MTEPYTASDVQLVARALGADYWTDDERAEAARAILSALAEAGRLAPDAAERVWGFTMGPGRLPTFCADEHEARRLASYNRARRVFSRAAGPWVEADEDSTPDQEGKP